MSEADILIYHEQTRKTTAEVFPVTFTGLQLEKFLKRKWWPRIWIPYRHRARLGILFSRCINSQVLTRVRPSYFCQFVSTESGLKMFLISLILEQQDHKQV